MLRRRDVLVGGAAWAATGGVGFAALPVPAAGRLGFNVIRKDDIIGTHQLTFERAGDRLVVHVAIDLVVKFGPIPVYRYRHRATETWQGDGVIALDALTDDDGDRYEVSGRRSSGDAGGLVVEATHVARYAAPADALPATHWNRRMLDGPLINTETGALMHPTITPLGMDQVPTAAGTLIRADHYALSGDVVFDTWYDAAPSWASIAFKGKDGSVIRYERL